MASPLVEIRKRLNEIKPNVPFDLLPVPIDFNSNVVMLSCVEWQIREAIIEEYRYLDEWFMLDKMLKKIEESSR